MKEIKILVIINILCASASMAFLAVVGPIIRALNLEEWHAGVMVGSAGIVWVLISRFWGRKSDTMGRKIILIVGVLGVAVSYLLMAIYVNISIISPPVIIISFLALLFTRVAMGTFYAAITPVSNALVADKVTKDKRTSYISQLAAANGLGMVIGPSAGGFLANYGLAIPLYVFAILPFLGAFIVMIYLKSEKPKTSEKVPPPKIFDTRLRLPMIAAFLTMYGIITSQVCLGFYIIDLLHLDLLQGAKLTGYVLATIGVFFIISQIFVAKTSFSPENLMKNGAILAILGFIIVSLMSTKLVLFLGFCIGTFGMGLIFPAFQTMAVNNVTISEQGIASGTVSSAQGLGMVFAPVISTSLYSLHPQLAFWAVVVAFGIVFLSVFAKKE